MRAIDAAGNVGAMARRSFTVAGAGSGATTPPGVPATPGTGSSHSDRLAPRVRLRFPLGRALLVGNRIAITLRANENALVTIKGNVGARGGELFRLKRVLRTFRSARTTKVRLTMPRRALLPIRSALALHQQVTVSLVIRAVDAAGNARIAVRSFRLRDRRVRRSFPGAGRMRAVDDRPGPSRRP